MAQTKKTEEVVNTTNEKKYWINLPLTQELQEDVWVCINGQGTQIQRGVDVEVSEAVYKVLQNTNAMNNLAVQRSRELSKNQ